MKGKYRLTLTKKRNKFEIQFIRTHYSVFVFISLKNFLKMRYLYEHFIEESFKISNNFIFLRVGRIYFTCFFFLFIITGTIFYLTQRPFSQTT